MARYPGHMIHLDVKKTGRIPAGRGWRAHGRGCAQAKAANRAKAGGALAGYVYLHSAVDGFSRLAYAEALPNETAAATIGFWARAKEFFTAHGIGRITRVVTDNGSNYLLPREEVHPNRADRRGQAPTDPAAHPKAQRQS